ncbi:MAG: MarR family transcriptional regulator [Chloroflexi bacterium]|nr:MAG: MarR family transcriptional regulator [Chloroflexota bacterium]
MPYPKQVPAVEKVLRLLEVLAAAPDGLTAGELEQSLQISRSSLFALLNTLKARQYIEQTDNRGPYRIGPALYALAPAHLRELDALIEAFHSTPDLDSIPETLALTRLDGDETVVVARQDSPRPVRVVLELGQRRPAASTADGLVLLAAQPHSAPPELQPVLGKVRRRGYARTADDETINLAVPVCPDGYHPVAALLMAAPAFRGRPGQAVLLTLRQMAGQLSYRLGATVYRPYGHPPTKTVEPTTELSPPELEEFLRRSHGARLACVRPDGAPHVVPLWYEWDGTYVWITASAGANWKSYIRQNPWVSLTIDEPWPPLRRVLIVGRAEPVADEAVPGGIAGLRERLEARYLGQRRLQNETEEGADWEAFRIVPQKIIGRRGLGGGKKS